MAAVVRLSGAGRGRSNVKSDSCECQRDVCKVQHFRGWWMWMFGDWPRVAINSRRRVRRRETGSERVSLGLFCPNWRTEEEQWPLC